MGEKLFAYSENSTLSPSAIHIVHHTLEEKFQDKNAIFWVARDSVRQSSICPQAYPKLCQRPKYVGILVQNFSSSDNYGWFPLHERIKSTTSHVDKTSNNFWSKKHSFLSLPVYKKKKIWSNLMLSRGHLPQFSILRPSIQIHETATITNFQCLCQTTFWRIRTFILLPDSIWNWRDFVNPGAKPSTKKKGTETAPLGHHFGNRLSFAKRELFFFP